MSTRTLGSRGFSLALSVLLVGAAFGVTLAAIGVPAMLWSAAALGGAALMASGAGKDRLGHALLHGAMALALLWLAVFTLAPSLALAASDGVADFNPAANALRDVLVNLLYGVGTIAVLFVSMQIKKWTGVDISRQVLDIEAKHRGTLHSAVETWTKAAMAKYGPDLKFQVGNPGLEFILDGIAASAPDAIEHLGPTTTWLIAKAAGVAGVPVPIVNAAGQL